MIIFLYGPDEYRRLQKKKEIIAEFRKKHPDGSIDYFDAGNGDELIRFRDFVRGQSLFDPKKLAVLENTFSAQGGSSPRSSFSEAGASGGESTNKELSDVLKESAKQANATVLISEKNKTNEKLSFLSRKSANVKTQDFAYLAGAKWEAFVSELAKENDVALQHNALKFLEEIYQNDTWGLVTEIQKIATLTKNNVGMKELETLGLEISQDFFGLLNGLKNYALENRMASLEKLFSTNEPIPKIFNIIAYQLPDKLGDFAKYDILVKSGKLDYDDVLLDIVL